MRYINKLDFYSQRVKKIVLKTSNNPPTSPSTSPPIFGVSLCDCVHAKHLGRASPKRREQGDRRRLWLTSVLYLEKAKSSLLFFDRFLPNALGVAECGDFPSVNRLHVVSDGWKKIHLEHTLHTLTVFINIKYWSWFSDAGQNRKLCLCFCASPPVNISTLFTDAGACFKTFFKIDLF